MALLVVLLGYPWPVVVFGITGAIAVIVVHRENIRRLLSGTEHRFSRTS
jgi:glycerol-3-phosphate acyltransferase PlsY